MITNHPREVYETIDACTHHGATVFKGTGSYENEERDMVYSVVSSDEVKMVLKNVREADPTAFINTIQTDVVEGRFGSGRKIKVTNLFFFDIMNLCAVSVNMTT